MAKLNFKTRGMSSPQGKPKVYFTCHPADFALYFETISDEILKSQNCAVWYDEELMEQGDSADQDEPGEDDVSEILADLSEMQLIVIPITSRFLYQDCHARTVEFAYACEHHIPVLPLMQEKGLAKEFNRICGDLQFLYRDNCDNTTDSYEEKLRKFLSSVLVDDDTAAKVRAAFDAYVFLSYRKKDRKYAKDLMRLIHGNDFCRDIAIWYDEYLIPGESFNNAIRDAMDKSSLFTLMVTPNLVNEVNYVMNVEYPAAKDAGKPVLPVEVVETSEEALKENYEGIPDCVRPQDQEELAKRLSEHFRDIAIRENDSDPQHLFFIGLAYLAGIDVEVDFERAHGMITTAAEAGLEEAMEKLVSMYRTGEGVERDYLEAIRWQESLVESRKRRYQETGLGSDGNELFWTQCDLGDFWYEQRKLPEAKRVYEEMRELAECMLRVEIPEALRDLSVSYNQLGNICMTEGDLQMAKDYYAKALDICEKLCGEAETPKALRDLSVCYDHMGNICKEVGDLQGAKDYYAKVLEISRKQCEETGTVESRRDLSVSYDHMGDICEAEGDLQGAKDYYAKALDINEELSEEMGTPEALRDLSVNYAQMGDICEAEGDLQGARDYYTKGLDIQKKLYGEIGTPESLQDLSSSYRHLGNICEMEGDLQGAKTYYAKSKNICEDLCEKTGTQESFICLSICYGLMSDICAMEGHLRWAKVYCKEDLDICKKLCKETETPEVLRNLSVSYGRMGRICVMEGDLKGAKDYYTKSIEISEKLCVKMGTPESLRDLSVYYDRIGTVCKMEGDLEGAKDYYTKSIEITEKLCTELGTFQANDDLALSYFKLAMLNENIENDDMMLPNYKFTVSNKENIDFANLKKAYMIWHRLIIESPGNQFIRKRLGPLENLLKDAGEFFS